MILVVLLNIAGVIAVLIAGMTLVQAGISPISLSAAGTVLLPALIMFGLAQVILALLRTAKAAEAALQEMQHAREAQERMVAVFDRLGKRQG